MDDTRDKCDKCRFSSPVWVMWSVVGDFSGPLCESCYVEMASAQETADDYAERVAHGTF